MKKSLLPLLLVTTAWMSQANAAATAQDYNAWYVGLDLSLSSLSDTDVSGTSNGKISYDGSISLSDLKVGYRPRSLYTDSGAVRFEAELIGRSFDFDNVTNGATTTSPDGSLDIGALMANALYDFHTNTAFTPYVGAGIGAAAAQLDRSSGFNISDDQSQTLLAGQFMAGVEYTPEIWPATSWSLGYNLLVTDKPEFDTPTGKVTLDTPVINSVQLGFKYHF